jgi:Domain of unknown function (DUF1707)
MTTARNELEFLPDHTRVGDAERAAVTERLSAHTAAGRLTVEELEQRLDLAHTAVVVADLRALETDLTLPPQARPALPWPPLLAIAVVLLVAGVAGSIAAGFPIPPLFIGAFLVWRLAAWHRGWGPAYARIAPR